MVYAARAVESLVKTIWDTLVSYDEPPSVTDLRYRVAEKRPDINPEEIRLEVFDLIRQGRLKLTDHRRLYR